MPRTRHAYPGTSANALKFFPNTMKKKQQMTNSKLSWKYITQALCHRDAYISRRQAARFSGVGDTVRQDLLSPDTEVMAHFEPESTPFHLLHVTAIFGCDKFPSFFFLLLPLNLMWSSLFSHLVTFFKFNQNPFKGLVLFVFSRGSAL